MKLIENTLRYTPFTCLLYTSETVRRVRDELGGKTILGVSNISFGLPQREIVNAAFFTMALQNGLNAAIINPNSEAMMRSYYSFRVLADLDPQCSEYISVYSGQVATPVSYTHLDVYKRQGVPPCRMR